MLGCVLMGMAAASMAQGVGPWQFKFTTEKLKQVPATYTQVSASDRYGAGRDYGYDFIRSPRAAGDTAFFSLRVPDGNYRVTVLIGSRKRAAETTVRAESRRLFIENLTTKKGEFKEVAFTVNKRSPYINERQSVRIKEREKTKLDWDDRLTLEFAGPNSAVAAVRIEPDSAAVTIFLCGNSTVVDQDYEPWASWGQMITRWFGPEVAIANFAESGETASTSIAANRLAKALSMMHKGDYLIVEFGHNDQKQRFAGAGAYYNFATALKTFVDEARQRGATPVFATPTQRRNFKDGRIQESHGDYPEAMRWVAGREQVPVVELHEMTRTLFETLGEEGSKKALVHYPPHTFPGQSREMRDNTHFNPFGAYEVARCVIEGLKSAGLPVVKYVRPDYKAYDPAAPDDPAAFRWTQSPFYEGLKPDGN